MLSEERIKEIAFEFSDGSVEMLNDVEAACNKTSTETAQEIVKLIDTKIEQQKIQGHTDSVNILEILKNSIERKIQG